jgi:hypothetical protein
MAWTVLNALLVPVLTEAATAHASGFNSTVRLGLNDWRTSLSSASVRWPDEIPQEQVRFGPESAIPLADVRCGTVETTTEI